MLNYLLGIAIVAAIMAIESKRPINSVLAFGVMGFSVCLSFMLLGVFDLALIQLAIEIALLIYLIRTTRSSAEPESIRWHEIVSLIFFIFTFAVMTIFVIQGTPFSAGAAGLAAALGSVVIFCAGIYCVAVKRNLIKIVIGIIIMEYAVGLFWVATANQRGEGDIFSQWAALAGLATTLVMVALAKRLYEKYGTLDISKMRKLKG